MKYIIREAKVSDAEEIQALHKKYLYHNLSEDERLKGFIKVEYSLNDIHKIIEANDIAICCYDELIVGYYLLGFVTQNEALNYQYKALNELSYNGKLLIHLKVACGAQAIVEKEFRSSGLTNKMLQLLIENVSSKYDYLMSSITKTNDTAFKVHEKSGYIVVGQTDTKVFVCLKINL